MENRILDELLSIKDSIAKMNTNLELLMSDQNNLSEQCSKHEEILFGDNKNSGKGGLINKVNYIQNVSGWIWTGIFTVVQLIMPILSKKLW